MNVNAGKSNDLTDEIKCIPSVHHNDKLMVWKQKFWEDWVWVGIVQKNKIYAIIGDIPKVHIFCSNE